MELNFTGPGLTIGIEEELMVLDAERLALANASGVIIGERPDEHVKPELHESVLEISTSPAADTVAAGAELRELRRRVRDAAARHDLRVGSSGTHPFSRWEDQRISAGEHYRALVSDLRFVARQEIIFGLHVHVAVDDADKAIQVANGMRVHVPLLLALSANSPFWRGELTGLASARMPIFRAFPRVGIPPHYEDWADYEQRIGFMVEAGMLEDYTHLWYDVRPHPRFGTVEVRAMDAQTRVEHSLALAALVQAMVRDLSMRHDAGERPVRYPYEMLDENKWLAARHGLEGDLVDLPERRLVPTKDLVRGRYDALREHAQDLGSAAELEGILDLLERGNGARRQQLVYEANHDFAEVMREVVDAVAP
jgi:glutamate---cysteine ligase / carboxylate-amine ligase